MSLKNGLRGIALLLLVSPLAMAWGTMVLTGEALLGLIWGTITLVPLGTCILLLIGVLVPETNRHRKA